MKKTSGERAGRVMWTNFAQEPAPSNSAASYNWRGICCSPARKISIPLPTLHRLITMSAGFAHAGLASHAGPSIPNRLNSVLRSPN